MDLEISITDMRDAGYAPEFDFLISAEPQHRVGDLTAALLSQGGGWQPGLPGLWLDGAQLDPSAPLASSGIRAGARLGLGGPVTTGAAPSRRPGSSGRDSGSGDLISLRADPANPFGWLVNKPFRTVPALPAPIVVDVAGGGEQPQRGRSSLLLLLIAPVASLAVGGAIVWFTHQWLFLLLGLGGLAGSLVPQLVNRRTAAGHARRAERQSQDAAAAGQARLSDAIAAEERLRGQAQPDPAGVAMIAAGPGTRLWERSPQDGDFLRLRAGTGDLVASTVTVRGSGFNGFNGPAAGEPAPVVRGVPVPVPLADLGVLGIAGPPAASRPALAWAVSQLAVLHGPSDLRLVLLTEEPGAWRWARWLPHLRPLGGATDWRCVGTDQGTRVKRIAELRDLVARRHSAAADPRRGGRERPLPVVVLVVDGSAGIRDVPGIHDVLSHGPAAGVFVICRDDDWRDLPGVCRGRLDTDPGGGGTGVYRERETGRVIEVARLDLVSEQWAGETARALAPIRDRSDERAAGTNGTVRLLDLWGIQRPSSAAVTELWRRGGRATRIPLGRTADGTPFTLDIAADGPHMLVAGTTGAGKSEFLQTLVSSLALGNSPDALVFVLIDYKGGAAFAGAARLPHVTGFLTNLDEHLGNRALVALRAESRYRQRLLADAGCRDLISYHAAGEPRGPLPRLVLVVDEFAVLAERMPDFLGELTDVTRQGRSMGIHLVLATQRPAGVVSEDIRSNMALRVCLRVEDPQDSTAVIEIPDAAAIDRRLRGRGFARIQRGAVVQFQGGYVGGQVPGSGPASSAVTSLRAVPRPFEAAGEPLPGGQAAAAAPSTGETDLSALVAAMAATGRHAPPHRAWLDPLPELISLRSLPGAHASTTGGLPPVVYGAEDRPAEQAQRYLAFDLETGTHLLIGGAPQSGRTTVLRTIAARIAAGYSPDDVQLYVLDCDAGALAPLQRLPHCGAVVRRTEKDRAARLLDRLAAEIARRHDLLAAAGFSSVTEQRRRAPAHERLPYMVLLLDRWESFSEDLGQQDNMRLTSLATRLLSEGAGAGLRIIATGDKTALARVSSHFPERIVLRLANANDLLLAGVPKGAMPDKPSQGRGVLLPEGTEVQLAFAGQDPSGATQTAAVEGLIEWAAATFGEPSPRPLRVDPLPSRITLEQARTLPGWDGRGPLRPAVAVGGDDLAGLGADLSRFPGFAIAGPPLSGRSTALLVLAHSLLETGTSVVGVAPRESPLRDLAGRDGVLAMFTDASPDQLKLLELLEGASGPVAVLVDDAEALLGTPADALLAQIPVEGRARGQALVIAGTSGELARGMRSFAASARQFKCGLLLTPDDAQQANMLLGTRLTRGAAFDRPAGRGYLVQAGQPVLVQVPELVASW